MSRIGISGLILILLGLACGIVFLLFVSGGHERACASYTYDDAVLYVGRNVDGSGFADSSKPNGSIEGKVAICTLQPQRSKGENDSPYIVNLCYASNDRIIGHAEVYPDCGLEWRRR